MDMQNIILAIVFAAAVLVVVRHLKKSLTSSSCNCSDESKMNSCDPSACADCPYSHPASQDHK